MRRIAGWIFGSLLLAVLVVITFTIGWRPFIGPKSRRLSDVKFHSTPQRLARGEYLVMHVSDCMGCHADHDWSSHDAPITAGTLGAGQDLTMMVGLPGKVYASNVTPDRETGIGSWTDDQIARAIREGVGHDGRALFPMMPYSVFRNMSEEDIASVVVYLRSIPPVRRQRPRTELIFPVKYLVRNAPEPVAGPVPEPDLSTPEKRGRYLLAISPCADCHTPQDAHGQPIAAMAFAGGAVLAGPWGSTASANITPDASGISYYDDAMFIHAVRTGYVGARVLNPIMPSHSFRGMTDEDLRAIFSYLKTLKPVRHHVDNSAPATYCKLCQQKHGGGDQNAQS